MPDKHKPLKIQFDLDTRAKLEKIALDTGLPMAQIIRAAVGNYYKMAYEKQPTCATGVPCLVAALHLQVHQPAPLGTSVPGAAPIAQPLQPARMAS